MNAFHRYSVSFRAIVLAVSLLAAALAGCSKEEARPQGPPPVEITAAMAVTKDAPLYARGIGHVVSMRTVTVRSQVTGYLKSTHFTEGDLVREGDKLFTIDPAPFEAKVKTAEANLARDTALSGQNERDFKRYQDLVAKKVVSETDFEQKRTAWQQSMEQVKADEAVLREARINLAYCFIYSPVTGATGYQLVKNGNLVTANTDQLTTINQIEPILIQFSVPERDLPQVRKYFGAGNPLPVTARLSPSARGLGDDIIETGKLTAINNTVDAKSGTVLLQAEFPNTDRQLWPGQFVEATLTLTREPDTIMVPAKAVVNRQDGKLVFVVKPDNTVELRPIVTGRDIGQETVIVSGLKSGETVAVSGLLKLLPGSPVRVSQAEAAKEPGKTPAPAKPAS